MSEVKDPKIKLFGKTIELPETTLAAAEAEAEAGVSDSAQPSEAVGEGSSNQDPPCSSNSMLEDSNLNRDAEEQESGKSPSGPKENHANDEDRAQHSSSEELKDSNTTPVEDSNARSADSDTKMSKAEDDQSETSNSQEKTLKKPDKILPCPRCNSMDTKFCYFNNYNVNQPRHFCKNCQRYWTAGGTMRNVPVGAGRRKNKNSVSQYRHLTVPEALQTARVDLPNGARHPALNPNGTVLTFSHDSPLCESMASVLNIVDKTIRNTPRNGFHRPEENGDDHSSSRSSITAASSKDEVGKTTGLPEMMPNCHPFPPQVPCYTGAPPWPYPWNSVQWGPGSFPVPFYSTSPPYWGCALPGPWNVPWVVPPTPNASQSHTPPSSGPNSPTLGKHSRDDNNLKLADTKEGETLKESNSEKCLWVPKTLRIDDPGEAAKSSIWATLGIKNDRVDSVGGSSGGGLFKAFQAQSKGDEKSHVPDTSTVLQANPAALSRSLNFQENS